MRKILILASTVSLLGAGSAFAGGLFQPSEPDSAPVPPVHLSAPVDSTVTAGVGVADRGPAGFSAAWDFGPSDENDLPAPRFQTAGQADHDSAVVTSSTGVQRSHTGYNASDAFGASY